MKAGASPLRVRTVRSATVLLIAGGMLLSGNTIAAASDLGSLGTGSFDTGSLDTGSLGSLGTGSLGSLDTGSLGSLGTGSLGSLGTGSAELGPTAKLASITNFRDVAGNDGRGYATTSGGHLKRGVIYRANALTSASDADLATLSSLNITHIYDVRGASEIANPQVGGPDKLPAGAIYKHIPIEFGDLMSLAGTIRSPEQGRQFMIDANRSFVTDPARRAGFKQVLTDIANSNGPVIFHCSAGKDRTGWVAALLQTLAGAAPATVMDDYLLSNEYLEETNAATLAMIRKMAGAQVALNLEPVLAVDKSYLEAGLAQMKTAYGDLNGYLTKGLGLDDATIAKLTHKLTA